MLIHHSLEQLRGLRLEGMARAFEEQLAQPAAAALSFEERLAQLIDRELLLRDGKRIDPTFADAILDRVVHAAHKPALKGESMRKERTT